MPPRTRRTQNQNIIQTADKAEKNERKPKKRQVFNPKLSKLNNDDMNEYSDPSIDDDANPSDDNEDECETFPTPADQLNACRPLCLPKYAERIIINTQKEEASTRIPTEKFGEVQNEVTLKMRSIVVRWLINIHHDFSMTSETLFNAVYYFDYVLSQVNVPKSELQLFGVVCLWVAAKVEEIRPPAVSEFVELCSTQYTISHFEKCEIQLLTILNFRLNFPHTKMFLKRYLDALQSSHDFITISNFICECSLFEYELNGFSPSAIAAAIIVIASTCTKTYLPLKKLQLYSHLPNYKIVEPCVYPLIFCAKEVLESRKGAIYHRYTDPRISNSVIHLNFDDNFLRRIQRIRLSTK